MFGFLKNIEESIKSLKKAGEVISDGTKRCKEKLSIMKDIITLKGSFFENLGKLFGSTDKDLKSVETAVAVDVSKKEVDEVASSIKKNHINLDYPEFKDISLQAFKKGIGTTETAGRYDIVHRAVHGVSSSAVGKYQFLRNDRGTRIKNFMHDKGFTLKKYDEHDFLRICKKGNNNRLLHAKFKNDRPYIYNFLKDPELQESYMNHYIVYNLKPTVHAFYKSAGMTYGSTIITKDGDRLNLPQMFMLAHFLGDKNGHKFIKKGWMALDPDIRGINTTFTEYSKKFTKNYNEALHAVA